MIYSENYKKISEQAAAARAMPLIEVMQRLGAERDTGDAMNWRIGSGNGRPRFSIDGEKFFDHSTDKGGGGAIDLVMQVQECDFKQAVAFLAGDEGRDLVRIDNVVRKSSTTAPTSTESSWSSVFRYLTVTRGLNAALVNKLHDSGSIYSDNYRNAIFRTATGCEIRGTVGKFHSTRGTKSPFVVESGSGSADVALCESAIEALSLVSIGFAGRAVGFSGQAKSIVEQYVKECCEQGLNVFAAFNNDAAGDAMSASIPERLRPVNKDWNKDLLAGLTIKSKQGLPDLSRSS